MGGSRTSSPSTPTPHPLPTTPKHFDKDGSGYITREELQEALLAEAGDMAALASQIETILVGGVTLAMRRQCSDCCCCCGGPRGWLGHRRCGNGLGIEGSALPAVSAPLTVPRGRGAPPRRPAGST